MDLLAEAAEAVAPAVVLEEEVLYLEELKFMKLVLKNLLPGILKDLELEKVFSLMFMGTIIL